MAFRVTKSGPGTTSRDEARDHLKKVVQAYEEGERSLSISQTARLYVVLKTTLYNRKRILISEEEEPIEN